MVAFATVCMALACSSTEPRIEFRAQRVHDMTPGMREPGFVMAVVVHNPGATAVQVVGDPKLSVRSVNSGGSMDIVASRIRVEGDEALALAAGSGGEWIFDLWQLSNLYRQGTFPDLRKEPEAMRFQLTIETDAGSFTSDEWAGVSEGSDIAELLLELRGGVEL